MTPIADNFSAIRAALAALEGEKRPEAAPAPGSQPVAMGDDDEVAEAYLLCCGGGR